MKPQADLFTWIKDKNEKQCNWAINYLQSKGYKITLIPVTPIGIAQSILNSLSSLSEDKKTLISRDMKNAWRQKQTRDNRKSTKSFNFVINTTMNKRLDNLAKAYDLPRNKTIERLIDNESSCLKSEQEELRANRSALKLLKQENTQLKDKINASISITERNTQLETDLEGAKAELKKLKAMLAQRKPTNNRGQNKKNKRR